MKITTIGIDLAKTVLQVHGVDKHGKAGLKKQLKRKDVSLRRLIITSPVAYATSPDCIRLTPARSIRSHAAVSEPCVSIARHAWLFRIERVVRRFTATQAGCDGENKTNGRTPATRPRERRPIASECDGPSNDEQRRGGSATSPANTCAVGAQERRRRCV